MSHLDLLADLLCGLGSLDHQRHAASTDQARGRRGHAGAGEGSDLHRPAAMGVTNSVEMSVVQSMALLWQVQRGCYAHAWHAPGCEKRAPLQVMMVQRNWGVYSPSSTVWGPVAKAPF